MKKLKLFFALFAMLALGVTNAWGETTISFGFSNWDGVTASFSGTAKDEVIQTVDGVKVTYTRNGSNLYANTSAIRFYKSNTLKFDAPTGYSIQSIAFTCSSYQTDITSNVGTCTATSSNLSWSGDATSVTFTRPSSASSYATITGATIILLATGGGENPGEGGGENPADPTPGTGGTVTYTVSSVTAVTTTGNVPQGSTAVLSGSGSLNGDFIQCTNGKNHTLTLKGYAGYKIKSISIHVKSNSSKGTGSFSVVAGSTTIASIAESAFNTANWNGSWNNSGVDKVLTMTNDSYEIQSGEDVKLTINCKSGSSNYNSLYIKSYTIVYESTSTGGETPEPETPATDLNDAQFAWSAATAEATMGASNTFPTLTNTLPVSVTYESSIPATATIAADGTITLVAPGATTISAAFAGGEVNGTKYAAKTVTYTLTVKPAPLEPIAGGVIDILDNDWSGLTTSDYATVAAKTAANTGHSNAQYTAQCAGSNSSIQLRSSNSNSGIVSTVSGGLVKRVEIEWNDATSAERTLNIYGSNTPYTNPTDLYDTNKDGDKLGTIVKGTSTHLEISEDYRYIGLRSASGAMYLAKVTITWLPINSKVTVDREIANGSISVSGAADLNAVAAGTELTLSNTPATGNKLTAYDVYKTGDNTTKVTVIDGKFIMPEFDVTISATFELAKTLTSIEITSAATQTTFWQGETFNYTGLEVTAHFDGAADEVVTPTVTGSTATAGTQTVTVSYKEGATTETATYNITVKAIPNTKETAYTVADAFDIIDKLGDTDKMYITGFVSQADLVQSTIDQYKNADYWISADGTTNGQQLEAYRGKYLDNADFTSVNQVMVGDEVIIYGKLTKYGSTYEFAAGNYLVSLKRDKQQPELSYTTTEYNVNLGEAFTAPTLNNPHILAVTYSTNNEDVATVGETNGAVTIKAAGTVTITASFAGNDTYVTGSASYTINITDPNQLEATFVAADDKGNTTQGEGEIIKSPITFACSDGILGNGEEYRIYANAKAIFSAAEGYIITKVVLTSTAYDDSKYGPANLSTEDGTYTYSGKEGTWVGEAYTVTLTATAQTRATLITVCYKQDNRVDAGLAWNPTSVTLTQGEAFAAPTLQYPNDITGTITYESSNEDIATINAEGEIALGSATGTATITATFAGDENYKPATATCTITVNEYIETIDGKWQLVTDASKLQAGMEIIIASVEVDGKYYAMGKASENGNNRTVVESTISGDKLNPAVGTTVLTLVDAGNGTFALQASNGQYLYAASSSSNYLREQAEISDNAKWAISVTEGKASVVAQGTYTHNIIRYNSTSTIFSCYASGQQDITLYKKMPDYARDVDPQYYGTICLPKAGKFVGGSLYEVAHYDVTTKKVYFDEVLNGEMAAGMPYVFLANETKIEAYYTNDEEAEATNKNGLYGTLVDITSGMNENGVYMIYRNQIIHSTHPDSYLNANRAYIKLTEVPGYNDPLYVAQAPAPGRKRIAMGTTGQNTATGVDQVQGDEVPTKMIINGQLFILRGEKMYDAQGKLVKKINRSAGGKLKVKSGKIVNSFTR